MRITRAKRKPPAFCREVRTGFCGLFGKITAFSAKMILKRTVLWYTFCAKPMILVDRIVTLRCRSPCGERGLKYPPSVHPGTESSRSPCGERGLKSTRRAQLRFASTCRSPCGERGLKLSARDALCTRVSRSPCGERGLKSTLAFQRYEGGQRRSPCGERGLKYLAIFSQMSLLMSLPVRGAWVEICSFSSISLMNCSSLPVRGAWVEIQVA